MNKASEVALEAALQAAAITAKNVMSTVSSKSATLAHGVHSRLAFQRQFSPDSANPSSTRFSPRGTSHGARRESVGSQAGFIRGVSDGIDSSVAAVEDCTEVPDTPALDGKANLAQFPNYAGPNGAPSSSRLGSFKPGGFQDPPKAPVRVGL